MLSAIALQTWRVVNGSKNAMINLSKPALHRYRQR
jgi:hypothetical protein